MAQVLAKDYECLTCKQLIRISKIDNISPGQKKKWEKYELGGVTPHICSRNSDQQQQHPSNNITKEIAVVKAQLLVSVSRLDRIEAELQRHSS